MTPPDDSEAPISASVLECAVRVDSTMYDDPSSSSAVSPCETMEIDDRLLKLWAARISAICCRPSLDELSTKASSPGCRPLSKSAISGTRESMKTTCWGVFVVTIALPFFSLLGSTLPHAASARWRSRQGRPDDDVLDRWITPGRCSN